MRPGGFVPTGIVRFLGIRWVLAVREHFLLADESGTHDQAIGTVVAGYLATETRWRLFRTRCIRAHAKARLSKPFHMTDFLAPKNRDYAHLSGDERRALIQTLTGGIICARPVGFIAAVYRQQYEATLLPELKRHIRDPYLFCFQLLLKIVLSRAAEFIPRGDRIAAIFETRPGMKGAAHAAYQEMRALHDPHGYLKSDCLLIEKREHPDLIAADILANRASRFLGRPGLRMARRDDPVLYRLLANRHLKHHWKYYDAPMLADIQRRMLDEGIVKLKQVRDG